MERKTRIAYPVLIFEDEDMYLARIPDFDGMTQGYDFADAMDMARDYIGLNWTCMVDMGETIPEPNSVPFEVGENETLTYVDINFIEYRRKTDNLPVKKKCTLPNWLCYEAEQAGINFSQVLQEALKQKLGIEG